MYNFIDVNEVSDGVVLPSEALMINGEYIENQISGYRTLTVQGREALSPDVVSYTTGVRDGSRLKSKRFPERIITVTYQLIAESNEAFREAYNNLAAILNVKDAELIFNDEQDKFFVGTPCIIDAVKPGTNSVIGSFEILCADPFKYSVVEYEAESNLVENGFLIDYKGTYKAFPTLDVEFLKEDEGAELTGNGDCGYVAFFNEEEKIIQLGDPTEADTETYPKSQTLVMQQFDSETAWGAVAQSKWATNSETALEHPYRQQSGNVNIAVTGYHETYDPVISGTLLTKKSTAAKPNVEYKVTAKASGREEDRINVKVSVSATVAGKTVTSYERKISTGASLFLPAGTRFYFSSTGPNYTLKSTDGTYYFWDSSVKNGRIRITSRKKWVGVSGQVTAWVRVSDTGFSTSGTKIVTPTGGLDKGYGLKCGVQLGSSGWKYVTLKEESASWLGGGTFTKTLDVTVKDLTADTTEIEDIKFKVERTDDIDDKVGIIEEVDCADLEISTYTAPVASEWYLTPESYGVGDKIDQGPSITRIIPADAAGDVGATNFTFSFKCKIGIGASSYSTQERGALMANLYSADNRLVASINFYKEFEGTAGGLNLAVNNQHKEEFSIDLSHKKATPKTCTITKTGDTITFNAYGIKKSYVDSSIKDVAVDRITFFFAQVDNLPTLYYNGIYWAKFVKNNCDTYEDIPNKFSANDVLEVDCKNGEILLNGTPTPSLGALGNDWEEFYLKPGLNQIGYAYSHWVEADAAPKCRVRYREVFI